jgi:hypothetical protein
MLAFLKKLWRKFLGKPKLGRPRLNGKHVPKRRK